MHLQVQARILSHCRQRDPDEYRNPALVQLKLICVSMTTVLVLGVHACSCPVSGLPVAFTKLRQAWVVSEASTKVTDSRLESIGHLLSITSRGSPHCTQEVLEERI